MKKEIHRLRDICDTTLQGLERARAHIFNITAGMPSGPLDLDVSRLLIILRTCFAEMKRGKCYAMCVLRYRNFGFNHVRPKQLLMFQQCRETATTHELHQRQQYDLTKWVRFLCEHEHWILPRKLLSVSLMMCLLIYTNLYLSVLFKETTRILSYENELLSHSSK